MNVDQQRDALGSFEREKYKEYLRDSDDFVQRTMIFFSLLIGLIMIVFFRFPSHDQIINIQNAEFQLRDKMDCQQLDKDLVYRGWDSSTQDNSDPYFEYDLKLHNEKGCKP